MRFFTIATLALLVSTAAGPVDLQRIEHKTIHDERTFVRDAVDRRYSIWTDDQAKATAAMKELGFGDVRFELKTGQILAVFFNDNITEDLVQIAHNKSTQKTFADYAIAVCVAKCIGWNTECPAIHRTRGGRDGI